MALTLEQAVAAGQLAGAMMGVQSAIDDLQAAIKAGATISELSATVTIEGSGRVMRAAIPMGAEATAGVFEQVIVAYQAMLDGLNKQLEAL